jgi:Mrp family chromosome partitioning ATPase
LPVLAAIPEAGSDDKKSIFPHRHKRSLAYSYRIVTEKPEGAAAEAFRNLRAALSLLGPVAERKITMFTSARPAEGKSFTSANYAVTLAQQGHRVLLIDGDLRRPSIHKIFTTIGGDRKGAEPFGLVDCLVGEMTLAQAAQLVSPEQIDIAGEAIAVTGNIVTIAGGKLYVLVSGRRAPNPAEILSGSSFHKLIAEASKIFDRIVIDSAPVLAVSDTLLMAPYIQSVCLVIRAAKTPRPAIQRALGLIRGAGARPAGLVLNRLPGTRGYGYYYYYASPGYGKGEGSYSGGYADGQRQA